VIELYMVIELYIRNKCSYFRIQKKENQIPKNYLKKIVDKSVGDMVICSSCSNVLQQEKYHRKY